MQLDLNVDLAYHTEDAPDLNINHSTSVVLEKLYADGINTGTAGQHIDASYDEVKNALVQYTTPGRR